MVDLVELLGAFNFTGAQVALFGVCVVLCVGLVNVFKQAGVPARWTPLVSLGVGVGLALGVWAMSLGGPDPIHPVAAIMVGLLIGLAASGAWSQVKTLAGH